MIPDEAVEAVAKVFYEDGWEGPPFWESLDVDDPSRLEYLATTRAALEVAAPQLAASSLLSAADEFDARLPDGTGNGRAYNSHQVARMLRQKADAIITNTYRSQA